MRSVAPVRDFDCNNALMRSVAPMQCNNTGIPFAQVGRLCGSQSARTDGGKPRPYGGYGDSHSVHRSGWSASERVRRATCEVLCRGGVYPLPPRPPGTHHLSEGDTRDATMRCQVGPGGCPPRSPTDPDVRDYRIRLLGTADSLRTTCALGLLSERVALRCRTGSVSPTSFPHSVPLPRRPLPSTGSLRDRFPGFLGTMSRSDSPPSVPVGSFPRPAVPSRAPCFAPNTGKHYP